MGKIASSKEILAKKGIFTKVKCYPLYSYLMARNLTKLDVLSLDVEGAEIKVSKLICKIPQ